MLDKRLAATGTAITLVAALAIVAALLPEQETALQIQEPTSAVAAPRSGPSRTGQRTQPVEDAPEPERAVLYFIREYEGYIAVFGADPDTPEMVLDKPVKHLPEYDRIQMREGIEIYSLEELNERIEDYIG